MPSPGEDVQSWSTTAANNGTADPLINWAEGQARASVNNSARSMMAAHAKDRNLTNGSIVTTGTGNAQQFLSGLSYTGTLPTAIPTGLTVRLKCGPGLTNVAGSGTTLNMDGLGAVEIRTTNGDPMRGGELCADGYVDLLYNGTNWIFLYSQQFIDNRFTEGGGLIIGKQVFSTPGSFTYTPTTGMECCIIECIGAGAGGSAAGGLPVNQFQSAGGGGGGGYSRKIATAADIGSSQAVIVGAGGASAAAGAATSIGTLCVANGGRTGGQGAEPGTGDFTCAGADGGGSFYNNDISNKFVIGFPGIGAPGPFGGGGLPGAATAFGDVTAGGNATGFGAGGGGGSVNNATGTAAGGVGSGGCTIITEFAGRGSPGRDGATGATGPTGPMGPAGPGTGDVLRSGIPSTGQYAQWTDAAHIGGVSANAVAASIGVIPNCGRLVYSSATAIKFVPYNGDRIKINGLLYSIPAAGISIANTGVAIDFVTGTLAANTTYLVVVADGGGGVLVGGFLTNIAARRTSTTAGNVGVEIYSTNDTLTVIGLVRTNAAGQFQDSAAVRGVLSWFNRQPKIAQGKFTTLRATSSTTPVELHSEIAVGFLVWAENSALLACGGYSYNNTAGAPNYTQIYVDGSALDGSTGVVGSAANYGGAIGMTSAYGGLNAATEGYHVATLYGSVGSGTGQWSGTAAAGQCTLTAQTFG